ALAWALRHPAVTTALVGASSVHQLEQNLNTLKNLEFTDEELARIDEFAIDGTARRGHARGGELRGAPFRTAPFRADELCAVVVSRAPGNSFAELDGVVGPETGGRARNGWSRARYGWGPA